jgi:hypothetical protein
MQDLNIIDKLDLRIFRIKLYPAFRMPPSQAQMKYLRKLAMLHATNQLSIKTKPSASYSLFYDCVRGQFQTLKFLKIQL